MPHPTVSGSLKSIRDYVPLTHLDSLPPRTRHVSAGTCLGLSF